MYKVTFWSTTEKKTEPSDVLIVNNQIQSYFNLGFFSLQISFICKGTHQEGSLLLSLLNKEKLLKILKHMLDPEEFLSPYGIRSLSKVYMFEWTIYFKGFICSLNLQLTNVFSVYFFPRFSYQTRPFITFSDSSLFFFQLTTSYFTCRGFSSWKI